MKVKNLGPNTCEVHFFNKESSVEGTNSFCIALVSYETPVAMYVRGKGYYRTSEKHSSTTTKHINKWLGGVNATVVSQSFFNEVFDRN